MLLSELKDEVDVKIVVAGISTTCSQKIHNQLQKTLRRANWDNQFYQNCWRIPQPRSSSTARSMLRVETAIAPMLARAATPFQGLPIYAFLSRSHNLDNSRTLHQIENQHILFSS
ncbi:uncharacterized protein [Pyrus communis]